MVDQVQGNVTYIYMQRGRGTVGKQHGRLRRCLPLTVCKFRVGNEPCYKEGAMDGGMQDTSTFEGNGGEEGGGGGGGGD